MGPFLPLRLLVLLPLLDPPVGPLLPLRLLVLLDILAPLLLRLVGLINVNPVPSTLQR